MGNAQNSGKSTLGIFLQQVLGLKLVATKSVSQLAERFSLGDIQGKLLNLSMDLPNGKLNAATVSIIKQITGGDTITVEKNTINSVKSLTAICAFYLQATTGNRPKK